MTFNANSFIYFPIAFVFLLSVGFFVCYGIAVSLSHVPSPPTWPYVSSTGIEAPESCIFTLILVWGAFTFLAIAFTYYKYIKFHGHSTKLNKAALTLGFIISFGITVVGSFQYKSGPTRIVHICGALAAFVGAVIYSWIVVYISWKYMQESGYGKGIIYLRLTIATVELVSLILLIVATILAASEDKFYNFSTISEWCFIYGSIFYIGTLIYEMNNVRSIRSQLDLHFVTVSRNEPKGISSAEFEIGEQRFS